MALKNVATQADVQTQPGTTQFTGAASGTWSAGPVSVVSYAKLTIGGQAVILSASCTFSFTGASGSTPPVTVTGSEEVTLSAAALDTTKLQGGLLQVLRDSNQSNTSLFGNVIKISSSEKLGSS